MDARRMEQTIHECDVMLQEMCAPSSGRINP
jgi:hypothetical protein